ncbi:MAG: hypothetical protein JWR38_5089 [Mucilaginibacter sp.]|nr:hypothetical protein [Mucilaginibacter sp.]
MKLKLIPFLLTILITAIFASCKKTVELPALPQNKITEYKVVNLTDTVIYGAIDQIEKSITVYVPFYLNLAIIDPAISVSQGASIVGKVEPIPISSQDVKYTVKAADGSTNVYTLKIVQQNTPSLTVDWSANATLVTSPLLQLPSILGDFQSQNGALVQVQMTNQKSGKVIDFPTGSAFSLKPTGNLYNLIGVILPADIDTGSYKVKVTYLGHTSEIVRPIHVVYQQPNLLIPSREAKQGGTISFTSFNTVFVGFKAASVTVNGKTYDLPIQSYTYTEMTLKIPDDFPVGVYNYTAQYSFQFDGWNVVKKTGALTVTPK